MEEAELMKERLLAITDKRRLQEDIAQRRLTIEEEKLKLHHLKKKSLREKWLLDGLSTMSPEEQEETLRQSQADQKQIKSLELSIVRLEQEIGDLEKEESQLSAKEVRVLQRLKSVERTTEDIIKAVKAEAREEPVTPVQDIYAGIPDLPVSYKPQFVKSLEKTQKENGEEPRKALFAMEIKVEKDMKTGKNKVLSSIPVPSSEFKDEGVKVYDDGRKSVFAVSAKGVVKNGVDNLAPIEVEDLLRKATEKSSQSPTEYHEPVFSNPFNNSSVQKGQISPKINGHNSSPVVIPEHSSIPNGRLSSESISYPNISNAMSLVKEAEPKEPIFSPSQTGAFTQSNHISKEYPEHQLKPEEGLQGPNVMNSASYPQVDSSSLGMEGDMHYNVVHTQPCYLDDSEPVTMIFMGYKNADEVQSKPMTDYEGIIRAELVVIDDDEDVGDGLHAGQRSVKEQYFPPVGQQPNDVIQKLPKHEVTLNSHLPYKNSISLLEQEASLGQNNYALPARTTIDDGTEDPSLTALRIRMAKLGKKVI
ncbi:palmdelphin [Pelobates cultripes]|uniref:Palmdelphin n=2 Tax=Pelobates cultripes TaxID=61616 RepID=A0AAD1ST92_PELCU|nr:palmdelphin [Pelobates cultripes]